MQLREIMTRNVEIVRPDATLKEAAEKMKALDVGPLPVCDGEKLVGMVTDRDITLRATAEGKDPQSTKVRDVMTPDVFYCYEDDDMAAAALTMEEQQVRRVPIVDREKRLVGIVSLGDLAVDTEDAELSGEVLAEVSTPSEPQR